MIDPADFATRWLVRMDAWRQGARLGTRPVDALGPGFAVYANTGLRALIEALVANYPSVARRLDMPAFLPLASAFASAHPATDARLHLYGEGFPEFLHKVPPSGDAHDLAELARLDRLWTLAHAAADATPLDFRAWAAQDPSPMARSHLRLAPATQWHAHDRLPIWDLWSSARGAGGPPRVLARYGQAAPTKRQHGQAVLVTRPVDTVLSCEIHAAACAFLQVCRRAGSFAAAAAAALDVDSGCDLQALLATLFAQGAFASGEALPHTDTPP